jgi:hypothetical protein
LATKYNRFKFLQPLKIFSNWIPSKLFLKGCQKVEAILFNPRIDFLGLGKYSGYKIINFLLALILYFQILTTPKN